MWDSIKNNMLELVRRLWRKSHKSSQGDSEEHLDPVTYVYACSQNELKTGDTDNSLMASNECNSRLSSEENMDAKPISRMPYFLQVGFDFGTAYSKCIIRDVATNRAEVFVPNPPLHEELPFLLPAELFFQKNFIAFTRESTDERKGGKLTLLKIALSRVAEKRISEPQLDPFRELSSRFGCELEPLVRACAGFYLGRCFGMVSNAIKEKYPEMGKHEDDRVYLNVALPVASADNPQINKVFYDVVGKAWRHQNDFPVETSMPLEDLCELFDGRDAESPFSDEEAEWYLYPEVSANVQGYVRSRTSVPGIYLFTDTGAGTVDQAVFIFARSHGENLTFLSAQVLDFGAQMIECEALKLSGDDVALSLDELRLAKEAGRDNHALKLARHNIRIQLAKPTLHLLVKARKEKLRVKQQLERIQLIFGGGGHCRNPYELGTREAFDSPFFKNGINPLSMGLPLPADLSLPIGSNSQTWLRRLSVAYGLSFPKYELARFSLPAEAPVAEDVWRPNKVEVEYPGKELV